MRRFFILLVLLALAGCATVNQQAPAPHPGPTAEIVQYGDERWVHLLGTDYEIPLLGRWATATSSLYKNHFFVLHTVESDGTKTNLFFYNPNFRKENVNYTIRNGNESIEAVGRYLCNHFHEGYYPTSNSLYGDSIYAVLCMCPKDPVKKFDIFIQYGTELEIRLALTSINIESLIEAHDVLFPMLNQGRRLRQTP